MKLYSRFWWDLHLAFDHQAWQAEEDNPQQHHQPPSVRPTSFRLSDIPSVSPAPAVHPCSCCNLHQSSDCCTLAPREKEEIRTAQSEITHAQVTVQTERRKCYRCNEVAVMSLDENPHDTFYRYSVSDNII